jgi:hypothetical protein
MRDWYFAPTFICLIVLISAYWPSNLKKEKAIIIVACNTLASIGLALLCAYAYINIDSWRSGSIFFDEACREISDERVFAYDGAGKISWQLYGCGTVTNGDGLVNSHDYFENVLAKNDFKEYLFINNIRYYIKNSKNTPYNCIVRGVCFAEKDVSLRVNSKGGSQLTDYQLVEIVRPKL